MRPTKRQDNGQQNLLRSRLGQTVGVNHPFDWDVLEQQFGAAYTDRPGRPPLPKLLVAGLAILKRRYNLSDEALCRPWLENLHYHTNCPNGSLSRGIVTGLEVRFDAFRQRFAATEGVIGSVVKMTRMDHRTKSFRDVAAKSKDAALAVCRIGGYPSELLLASLRACRISFHSIGIKLFSCHPT